MPKLNQKMQKAVESAEAIGGDFEPLEPGKYLARLRGVTAKNSSTGKPMWIWEFDELVNQDGEKQPGRQWYNTMVPQTSKPADVDDPDRWEKAQRMAAGRMKATFEAFGYSLDSDTDEMIGEQVVLHITIETMSQGPRAGQNTNRVNNLSPADEEEAFEGMTGAGASEDDDDTY